MSEAIEIVNSEPEVIDLEVDFDSEVSARDAEAWAVGKRGGVDVGEGDPTYHNNSKYYSEFAESEAQEAIDTIRTAAEEIRDDAVDVINQAAEDARESIPSDYTQLSDDVTSLKSAFEQFNDNVIVDSAGPAPIVSIADGADGMPMRKVEVAIEPVQDLHGYDYPWPAGGGVNQFDESTVTFGKWINAEGVKATAEFGCISEAIPINGNSGCVFKYYGTQPNSCSVVEYASDDTFITRNHASNGNVSCTFNANTAYIVVQVSAPSSPSTAITPAILASYKMLLCFGSTAPTDYTPYSNVCPITGWDGVKVTRTGKNLWKNEYPNISTGSRVTYYPVYVGNNPVTVSTDAPGNSADVANLFALPGNVDTGANSTTNGVKNDTPRTVTPVDGYITIGARSYNALDPREYHTQVEIGSTATAYEPYQGQTYEVTFPSDPGTVYGGTLDVTAGVLTVDRAIVTFDGTISNFGISIGNEANRLGWNGYTSIGKAKADFVSDKLAITSPRGSLYNKPWYIWNSNSQNSPRMYISVPTTIASVEDFVAYTAENPITVVYELATQQEITITPTEIKTLLGENNLFADAGNTAITYPADTKMYIDNRINSTRKLIAGIETSFVASKAYVVGDMLIIGDDLYKVASAIASGATITVGTNVNKTTVAEQLLALANA